MMIPGLSQHASLLISALLSVVGLVVLIARFRMNAFVALVLASLAMGIAAGMNLSDVATAFQNGVGKILGGIGMIIGLGTLLGKLLAESGGARVVADTLIRSLGEKRLPWAMLLVAFTVGIPVWFSVGLVLLVPILFTVARQSRVPLLVLGIPLAAGLSVTHGLVPPHPGPMVAIGALKADVGRTIFYSLLIGLPTAIVSGPFCARWLAARHEVSLDGGPAAALTAANPPGSAPGFGLALLTILLPVGLMLMATGAEIALPKENPVRAGVMALGQPLVAMTLAFLFACWSFGTARGFNSEQILKFTNDCVGPVAGTLLIVGAGGGFNGVLIASGVGTAIADMVKDLAVSPLILGWVAAALIRVATGSATVAITTAAGILAPIVAVKPGTNLELLVLSMGAGSLTLSHVNDGGFWFVKEYFNLTVTQTLKTWTVMETVISVVALVLVLALDVIV